MYIILYINVMNDFLPLQFVHVNACLGADCKFLMGCLHKCIYCYKCRNVKKDDSWIISSTQVAIAKLWITHQFWISHLKKLLFLSMHLDIYVFVKVRLHFFGSVIFLFLRFLFSCFSHFISLYTLTYFMINDLYYFELRSIKMRLKLKIMLSFFQLN